MEDDDGPTRCRGESTVFRAAYRRLDIRSLEAENRRVGVSLLRKGKSALAGNADFELAADYLQNVQLLLRPSPATPRLPR